MEHLKELCFPFPPQCQRYEQHTRCAAPAVDRMYAPDGKPVPGGYYCQAHTDGPINEYREKLNEVWTSKPLHVYEYEKCVMGNAGD